MRARITAAKAAIAALAVLLIAGTVVFAATGSGTPGTATSTAATGSAAKKAPKASVMRFACARRGNGLMRYAKSSRSCGRREVKLDFTKGRVQTCVLVSRYRSSDRRGRGLSASGLFDLGATRRVARASACGNRTYGREMPLALPDHIARYFCAMKGSRRLHLAGRRSRCGKGGKLVVVKAFNPHGVSNGPGQCSGNGCRVVASPDTANTDEGSPTNVNVLANDDAQHPPISVHAVDRTGLKGQVTVNGDGTIHYDPNGQFESLGAGDTGADSFKYDIKDRQGRVSAPASVNITVAGVNDAPVLSSIESGPQNYLAGGAAIPITSALDASDVDDSALEGATVRIGTGFQSGADTLQFTDANGITGAYDGPTGVLTLTGHASVADYRSALRSVAFHTTAGANTGNRTVSFKVNDGSADSNTLSRNVYVDNTPTDVTIAPANVDENQPSGTDVGTMASTDADAGDTFTYTLVAGAGSADNGSFTISGNTLKTAQSFDFETAGTRHVRVRTDDGHGGTFEKALDITINNVNDAPTDIALSNSSVAENQPSGTAVGNLSSTDQDAGDTFTYTLVAGTGSADNGSFQISGGQLQTAASFNFEAKSSYSIRIRTTDSSGTANFEKQFTINVTNANDAPTDIALSPASVAENQPAGTSAGNFTTTDEDAGDTFTYSLVAGAGDTDNGSFTIVGGHIETNASFDFETKSSYSVRVRSTDSSGTANTEKAFTINVTDANEAPTDIALSGSTIAENQASDTAVGNFSSTDVDAGDTHSYTLVSGAGSTDNGAFQIVGNDLRSAQSFNFESKSSYSIRVRSTDGGTNTFEKQFTITVTNVNDAPTFIALSNSSVDENRPSGTPVGSFFTGDEDAGDTHAYTLVTGTGDTDNASFQVVGGQLWTTASFNFETKSSYSVRVRTTDNASNGGAPKFFEQQFTIFVVNVNEDPTDIALSNNTVAENQPSGTDVGTLSSTDPDAGDTFTYTLAGGPDDSQFTISGDTLKTAASFNFEAKSSYSIRVRTTDSGGKFFEKDLTVNVTNANETPTAIALSNNTFVEHSPPGTAIGDFSTLDPDAGDTFIYTFATGTGDDDNGKFQISGQHLQVKDDLAIGSYTILVRSTDAGGQFTEQQFTITAAPPNFNPLDIGLSNQSVLENQPQGTVVGTLSTVDPDAGDTHTYTIVAGPGDTDNADFQINGDTLEISHPLDFEADSTRDVRIRTTDNHGGFFEKAFTINVFDVNDAPTDIALDNDTVAENQPSGTAVGNFSTTDQDPGDTHGYGLVSGTGDTDNGAFQIVGNQLQTAQSFNFEAKSSYSIRVRTTDSGASNLTFDKVFTITITDANDAPTDIALSNNTVAENQPSGTSVGDLSSTDADPGDTFTYTLAAGGVDNGSFQIVGNHLQTNASFDFETKSSYSIRIRSTDNGSPNLNFEEDFTVHVTNVNEAPTLVALTPSSIAENSGADAVVGTLSTTDPDAGDTFTYSLVSGTGDDDNAAFNINGSQLRENASFDFETKSTYKVRVRSTDSGSLTREEELTVTVTDANDAPTDIALSSQSVDENQAINTSVGNFSTTDQDAGQTFTYTLVSGTGSTDNASFNISGGSLRTSASFNFEVKNSYSIRVRTTDNGSPALNFEKVFTITVNDINDAPQADNETFSGTNSAVPNTSLVGDDPSDGAPDPAGPQKTITADVLNGDTDEDVPAQTLTVTGAGTNGSNGATTDGGTVTIEADGDFVYTPNPGQSCTDANHQDSFNYTVSDQNSSKPGPQPGTAQGTVTINLISDCPWYIDSSKATNGNGTSSSPFNTLTSVSGAGDADSPGNVLFVYQGTGYTSGLTLENTETLLGQAAGLKVPDGGGGAGTTTLEPPGGASSIAFGLVLGQDNKVQGINLGANGGGPALSGTNVGNAKIGAGNDTTYAVNSPAPGTLSNTLGGGAVNISGGTLNIAFGSLAATGPNAADRDAIRLDNTAGTFSAGSSSVITDQGGSTQQDVDISGNNSGDTVDFTYDGTISDSSGPVVSIANQNGGTKDFNGLITSTGGGISASSNTGATIRFDGGLNLSTGANNALSVTGGGKLFVPDSNGPGTAPDNTLTTTTGTALNVQNTSIGTVAADDLNFKSISASDPTTSGIILNNTSTPAGLVVTGNSSGSCGGVVNTATTPATVTNPVTADCTGGTISSAGNGGTDPAINLTSVPGGASLTRMNITGGSDDGVRATTVGTGVSLLNSVVSSNGNGAGENGLDYTDVTGTSTISATTVSGSGNHNAHITSASGTSDYDVINSVFSAPTIATGTDGLQITGSGTATVSADVTGTLINAARDVGFHVVSLGGSPTFNVNFLNNDIVGDPANAIPASQGLDILTGTSSHLKANIDNNDITFSLGKALVLNPAPDSTGTATFDATVNGNRIGNNSADSGSGTSNTLEVDANGSATTKVAITNNTIKHWQLNALRIDSGEKLVGPNLAASADITVTGNSISNPDTPGNLDTMQINVGLQSAAAAQNVCADYGGSADPVIGSPTGSLMNAFGGQHGPGAGDFDLQISERFNGVLRFPGYVGPSTDQAQIQTYIRGRNTGNPTVALIDNGIDGGAACAQPALPPVVTP